ncbi:MAG: LamG domain-containing protein [Anaerolineae bacterium]
MAEGTTHLHFDGIGTYIEVPSSPDFSVTTTGELTVSARMRPETLSFASAEGSGYVHWLGKGEKGQYEWTFRMYSEDNSEGRGNRISFYVFNPTGGLGTGSHFQDTLEPGQWIHVVGAADTHRTYIYRDGIRRDSDVYAGKITPHAGNAPLRIGTRDLNSFFQGEISEVRLWNRLLSDSEVADLFNAGIAPAQGLVAEYLLTQDIAPDSAGRHNGVIHAPSWLPDTGP